MKKIITVLSGIHLCLISMTVGQSFTYHSNSPFGIQLIRADSTRAAQTAVFHDYDNDGDKDIFLSGVDFLEGFDDWSQVHFFLEVQENIGSPQNPIFGDRVELYSQFPIPEGYFFPAPGDLNDDGEVDFISAAEIDFVGNGKLIMYTNTGVPGPNQFDTSAVPALYLSDFVPESFFRPILVDLDLDGDLDLMNSGIDPAFAVEDGPDIPMFYYARNTGTNQDPFFEGWYNEPYGLTPDPHGELLTSGDIDNDSDVDFLGSMMTIPGDSMSHLVVHLNTPGSDGKPEFTSKLYSPFGLPSLFGENQFAFPELVDIDTDGDLDLFVFRADADGQVLQFYQNNLCAGGITELLVSLCDGDVFTIDGSDYDEAGEYSATLTASNGCDSIVEFTISIVPLPTSDREDSICVGQSITIGTETFTEEGNYTIYVSGGDGCDTIVNLSLTVNSVDNFVVVEGTTLEANFSGGTYQWIDCTSGLPIDGATNQVFTPQITGSYAVNVTDGNGCTAISECQLVIISGIEEERLSREISIYPNPGNGVFYIQNKTSFPATKLTIYDLSGQHMIEIIPHSNEAVDISSLGQGVYIVKIRINEMDVVKRLIVM